ncbi:hypothetical protein FGIG_02378 [Fasciola gigantica]|uniref:Uncharacterized protein n=1 Tax=Fasciola gigantica TaxID=46835 RepID=A0A504YJH0_FASGI|nr:hypothetical protein FGIG_02378 [Fasciola gigantica]
MGFECDQKHAVCRSKRAICDSVSTQTSRSFNPHKVPANFLWPNIVEYSSMANGEQQGPKRICQCPNTMVAVYQSTLGYTECFPQLGPKAAQCHSCFASGGLCYDLNNDGVGDGCACPPHKSLGSKLRSTGEQSCTGIQVSAELLLDGHLSVCYRPHSAPPYEHLTTDLTEGKAVAKLVPTNADNMAVFHEYLNEDKEAASSDTDARSLQFRDPCQLNKMESNLARMSNQMAGFTGPHSTGLDQSIQEQHCVQFDVWQMKQTCVVGFPKIPSTVRDYPVDYALRQFNFRTDPSSSSNPKYPPCHFTLCLNTTHLAWISIALLTVIMLFVLVLLFMYKRKRYIECAENPINAKKQTMQHRRQRARSQAINYEECSKIISNRTYVPNVSLETGSDRQTQSVLRVPPCLLGTTPTRTTEPFVFEQQSVRESGIMSPVFYGSDSSCPERPGSQLFRYRDSTGRSTAGITTAMSSEGLMVNSNIPCRARIGHSDAYCYSDQLSRRTMELGSDRNQTMPLERRARRLQHIVNFTRAQRTSEFDQIDEEAMITTGWQQTGTNTDLISCGYSSSEDRKQLLQTLPHQTRRSGQEGYLNEHNDSAAQTIQPLSTDLIVLNNNCTDSSEPNSKRTSYAECTKGTNQQMHM